MPTQIVPMDRYLIPQLPFHEERPELHLWPINYAIYYYAVEENYFHDRNGIKVTTLKFEKVKGNFLCAHIQHGVCRLSQWSMAGWDSISERVWRKLRRQGAIMGDWATSTVWETLMCKSERNRLTMSLMFALWCLWLWNEKADTVWGAPCKRGKPQASESLGLPNIWVYFSTDWLSPSSNSHTHSTTVLLLTVLWALIKHNAHAHTTSTITTQTMACTVNRNQMSQ